MQEYSIQRSQRRCHKTDRPFLPGESYYSAVIARGGDLRRIDMSEEAWSGPPQGAIGWWQSRVPARHQGARQPAPTHVLLATLESLLEEGTQPELAYLLALLLIRRRVLSEPTASLVADLGPSDASPDVLHLVHGASKREFEVPVCEPLLDECDAYQDQLTDLLFCEN